MRQTDAESQVRILTQKLAENQQRYKVLAENHEAALEHLNCKLKHPDRPHQTHGYTNVCKPCYDALHAKYVKAELLVESITQLVSVWMRSGSQCPFCQGVQQHTTACYLHEYAGTELLDEYAAIEVHRDELLAHMKRHDSTSTVGKRVVRVSLRARLKQNIADGGAHA